MQPFMTFRSPSFKELSPPVPTTQIFHEKGVYECADFTLVGKDLRTDTYYVQDKFGFVVNSTVPAIIVLYDEQVMWTHAIPVLRGEETYKKKKVSITKTGFAVEGITKEIYTFDRDLADTETVTFRFHLHGPDTDVHSHAVIELWPSTAVENKTYPVTHDVMVSSFVYVSSNSSSMTEYDKPLEYLDWMEQNTTKARLLYGRVESDNPDYATHVEINLSIKKDEPILMTGPCNPRRIYGAEGLFMFAVQTWHYVEYDTEKTSVHIPTKYSSRTTKEQDVTLTQRIIQFPVDLVLLEEDGRLYDFGSTGSPTKMSRADLMLIEHDDKQTVFAFAIDLTAITDIYGNTDVTRLLEDPRIYEVQQTVDKDVSVVIELTSTDPNDPIHMTKLLLCGRLPENFKVLKTATAPSL